MTYCIKCEREEIEGDPDYRFAGMEHFPKDGEEGEDDDLYFFNKELRLAAYCRGTHLRALRAFLTEKPGSTFEEIAEGLDWTLGLVGHVIDCMNDVAEEDGRYYL